jgi:rSAM/selenodomain-associated transferase 2
MPDNSQDPPRASPALSIIVPVLNEAAGITDVLMPLAAWRARGAELIVVDGGSSDDTAALCSAHCDLLLHSPRGRASQMNAGAASARGTALLFLHADTRPPDDGDALVAAAIKAGACWGRFDVRIAGRSALLPLIAALMNLRSRWSGIATGDQAIFVRRDLFVQLGGYAEQPLMEDIDLSRRLLRIAHPACLRARATTSGRRWDTHGAWRTVWLMWTLRWRYWRGTPADVLARAYR